MDSRSTTISSFNITPGTVIANRYEVIAPIGTGGMGIVFRVNDLELNDRGVALKILHPHLAQDEEVFARFRNEVLVARTLSHPSIVRIHDIGRAAEGFSYITMEYVDGYSLKDRLACNPKMARMPKEALSFNESVRILFQIIQGVAYAHEKGVIHRDLKPANVLISHQGEVKLADFGTARILGMDGGLTQTGQAIGTPDYMSPEQVQGKPLDAACDIYALGIIAFELAVGHPPFVAETAVAVAFKHLSEALPEIISLNPRVPLWYQEMVQQAAQKDKERRFATAYDMADVLYGNVTELRESSLGLRSENLRFPDEGSERRRKKKLSKAVPSASDTRFELGETVPQGSGVGWRLGDSLSSSSLPRSLRLQQFRSSSVFSNTLLLIVALLALAAVAGVFFERKSGLSILSLLGSESKTERKVPEKTSAAPERRVLEDELLGQSKAKEMKVPLKMPDSPAAKESEVKEKKTEKPEESTVSSKETIISEAKEAPKVLTDLPLAESSSSISPSSSPAATEGVASQEEPSVAAPPAVVVPPAVAVPPAVVAPPAVAAPPAVVESPAVPIASEEKLPSAVTPAETSAPKTGGLAPAVVEAPVPLVLKASLLLFSAKSKKAATTFSLDELASLTWQANVSRADGKESNNAQWAEPAERLRIFPELSFRIINRRKGSVIQTFEPELKRAPARGAESLEVGGSLAALQGLGLSPGDYRVELLRNGVSIAERSFALLRPVPEEPPTVVAELNDAKESVAKPLRELPLRGEENTRPQETAKMPVSESAEGAISSAPIPEVANANPEEPRAESVREETAAALGSSEHYVGTLRAVGDHLERAFKLHLIFSGNSVSGSSSVDGIGELKVSGELYPRGFELWLRNTQVGISLSGTKRNGVLRGRYFISKNGGQGAFEAKLSAN